MSVCPFCGEQVRPHQRFCSQCGKQLNPLLDGRYEIVRELGRGGMGAVYLAHDKELFDRPCVIKEMLPTYVTAEERRKAEEDFRREAQLLTRLNEPGHPSIPEIYGHFVEAGKHYLVMKWIAGENLEQKLSRLGRPLSEKELLPIAVAVCDALVYMHQQTPPVLHRDIKPANIIVGEDGRVWLVDFGLARAAPHQGAMVMHQGKSVAMGTPGYTPLEQWQGNPTPASDVYALGATMHHLLTGRDPRDHFANFPEVDLTILKSFSHWPSLRSLAPGVSQEMEDLVASALADDPAQRPTAIQMRERLKAWQNDTKGPLDGWMRKYGPALGRVLGEALAAFLRRILWGPGYRIGSHERRWFRSLAMEGSASQPCPLCNGTGALSKVIKCPLCGGTGR